MDPLPGDDPYQVAGGHDQHTCTWQGAHGANTYRLGGTMHSIVVLSPDPSMRFTVNAGGGIDTDNLSFCMGICIDGHLATGILGKTKAGPVINRFGIIGDLKRRGADSGFH